MRSQKNRNIELYCLYLVLDFRMIAWQLIDYREYYYNDMKTETHFGIYGRFC